MQYNRQLPLGPRYLFLSICVFVALGTSYFFYFHFALGKSLLCDSGLDFRFAKVINNVEGKYSRLVPLEEGPINFAYLY